jgi:hypothetical protein
MKHRRTPDVISGLLAPFAIVIGVCSLRSEEWPAVYLPSWLDLQMLFALALCASAAAQIRRLLPLEAGDRRGTQPALRRMSRSLYAKIYAVIGVTGLIDWAGTGTPVNARSSSLFEPAALALGRLEPSRDLKLLVAHGIAALIAARVGAAWWARRTLTRPAASRPESTAAPMRSVP